MTILAIILFQSSIYADDVINTSKQTIGKYIVGANSNNTPDFIKYFDAEYTLLGSSNFVSKNDEPSSVNAPYTSSVDTCSNLQPSP